MAGFPWLSWRRSLEGTTPSCKTNAEGEGEGEGKGEGKGKGEGEGEGKGEGEGPVSSIVVGADKTVIPSAADAVAAVLRREESVVCNASAVVDAGTLMVAVMITLAAATLMDTKEASTPALTAIEVWRAEVSE